MDSYGLFGCGIYGALTVITAYQIYDHVPEPYMDEIFHIPQAQKYCSGKFLEWDEKITTLPGLYIISIGIINPLMKWTGQWLCTTNYLRLINLLLVVLTLPIFHKITKQIHGDKHYFDGKKALLSAASLGIFPLFYFFSFLYYTDVGSTFMVMLMYSLHLDGNDWFASFIGALSVLFRQTNIVWVFFVASQSAGPELFQKAHAAQVEASNGPVKFSLTTIGQTLELFHGLYLLMLNPLEFLKIVASILRTCLGYILVGLSFLTFMYLNDGVVVGDRSAHQMVFHPTQILYFCAFSLLFNAPYTISRILPFFFTCKKHWIMAILTTLLIVGCIQNYTFAHPYLLADNRHYTFYIWRRLITRYEWMPMLLSPIYLFGLFCILYSIRRTDLALKLTFPFCVIINLVPQYLLEFRYFVIPFLLCRLQVRPQSWWKLIIEFSMFLLINLITLYLFLFKSFRWSHDPENIQRFMW